MDDCWGCSRLLNLARPYAGRINGESYWNILLLPGSDNAFIINSHAGKLQGNVGIINKQLRGTGYHHSNKRSELSLFRKSTYPYPCRLYEDFLRRSFVMYNSIEEAKVGTKERRFLFGILTGELFSTI